MNQKAVELYILKTADDGSVLNGGEWVPFSFQNITDGSTADFGIPVESFNMVFNGAIGLWDKAQALTSNSDAQAAAQRGLAGVVARLQGFNGTSFDRLLSQANNGDAVAVKTLGLLAQAGYPFYFNGTSWDRARNNSAANVSAVTQPFAQAKADPGEWSINHTPAAATKATITKAAGGAGVRHVCRSITANLVDIAGTGIGGLQVSLRDGATGAGTVLWAVTLGTNNGIPVSQLVALSGLNIVGSPNTAMTLEFSAAPPATDFQSVSLSGYSTI